MSPSPPSPRAWTLVLALGLAACTTGNGDADASLDAAVDSRDGGELEAGFDAATDGAGDASLDASPADADVTMDSGTPAAPSPANLGWIGGACADASACTDLGGAECLRGGFANGACTQECTGICPDRGEPTDTLSFCVDGAPYGRSRGLCFARCDRAVLPPTGCPEGYVCAPRNRFGSPRTSVDVCVPERVAMGCPGGVDELIDLPYPDRGALWVPREAACGGDFDLLVMLHGINPSSATHSSLGGGRNLQQLARALLDEGRITPLILAEPVHFQASSSRLYGAEYDPVEHLSRITSELEARGIRLSSISFSGHSGAGCNRDNGLYKVLEMQDALVPRFAPSFRLVGFADVCYGPAYHAEIPTRTGRGLTLVNMLATMATDTEADAFEAAFLGSATAFDCDPRSWRSCRRHASERWCSYRGDLSTGIDHDTAPYWFFREVVPRVFGTDPAREACR
ncbi:MAG: hypothetical protein GXP55_05870 [Deltaproteobacteria bacterium]|nr:hypothetical protein [Deltaproteobacteria bacterium]